jgi:competence ComEA-like helix-hairpin-helix protein
MTRGKPSWVAWLLAGLVSAAPLAAQAGTAPSARPPVAVGRGLHAAAAVAGTCNVNTADAIQLALLPGIGPGRAHAIIAHRQKAPFRAVEDLVKVKGIGRKTFARLRPFVAVTGANTIARARTVAPR